MSTTIYPDISVVEHYSTRLDAHLLHSSSHRNSSTTNTKNNLIRIAFRQIWDLKIDVYSS